MPEIFIRLIEATAWPMAAPKPYSPFHLLLNGGPCGRPPFGHRSGEILSEKAAERAEKSSRRLLFACGLVLMFMEAYKQCFLVI